jgi:hypothetical protein
MVGQEDDTIYGLLYGFEDTVDKMIREIGHVSHEQFESVIDVLSDIEDDPEKTARFTGVESIDPRSTDTNYATGVDRHMLRRILTYLHAKGEFRALIRKMDPMEGGHSPMECSKFELQKWDK